MDSLLKPQEVAERLGLSVHTLKRWRLEGKGPKAIKLTPRTVRYAPEELESWIVDSGFVHPKDIDWSTTA